MRRRNISTFAMGLLLCASLHAAPAIQSQSQNLQAIACTKISPRLDRLACFDKAFHTPKHQHHALPAKSTQHAPTLWRTLVYAERDRSHREGFVLHQSADHTDLLLSARAITPKGTHAKGTQAPILVLSCRHKISRITLLMPKPIAQGQAKISIISQHTNTQRWLSDDSGLMMQSAQGLPAIAAMKAMLHSLGGTLRLRSDIAAIDGLQFDVRTLSAALKPLRNVCRW